MFASKFLFFLVFVSQIHVAASVKSLDVYLLRIKCNEW